MPVVQSPRIPRKFPVPVWMKLVLLLAVVLGLVIRSYLHKNDIKNIQISNVMISDYTKISADVTFEVENLARYAYKDQAIMIKIFTHNGEEIASRLAAVDIQPKKKQRFLKVLDKFERPLQDDEVPVAEVTLYKPGLLD